MNIRDHADRLLEEFNICCRARPMNNTVDVQIAKDAAGKWAVYLNNMRAWGTDNEIAEACYQLEPKLKQLKEKIVTEVLTHGI